MRLLGQERLDFEEHVQLKESALNQAFRKTLDHATSLGVTDLAEHHDQYLYPTVALSNIEKLDLELSPYYIALGELKGGIDPAGADEHWKTASKALSRIRDSFSRVRLSPYTFFVGAAIATEMAKEIWSELEGETLSNAANLTNEDQVASLCHWLVNL